MHYEAVCVLCASKLIDKNSRINVRGCLSFPIEEEIKNLPLFIEIDNDT